MPNEILSNPIHVQWNSEQNVPCPVEFSLSSPTLMKEFCLLKPARKEFFPLPVIPLVCVRVKLLTWIFFVEFIRTLVQILGSYTTILWVKNNWLNKFLFIYFYQEHLLDVDVLQCKSPCCFFFFLHQRTILIINNINIMMGIIGKK